ncbi:MAG: response regulator transcription factor [Proteobacteria bacterium]|nr:MAG: response regulator transcription factor [Pseudomonadota bacterium]
MQAKTQIGKILLVEDAVDVQLIVRSTLNGICDLDIANSVSAAEQLVAKNQYRLILLDVMLPDGEGFELCERLRSGSRHKETPIIFVTGRSQLNDRLKGFQIGGDDYIVKPFEPEELIARVLAKVRSDLSNTDKTLIESQGLKIDLSLQKAFAIGNRGEHDLSLTPIELKILTMLLRKREDIVPREDLIYAIWKDVHVSGHAIDTHISSLRKKLGDGYSVKSVFKKGYVLRTEHEASSALVKIT